MSTPVKYTMTNDSITVIHDGQTHVVRKGAGNFNNLRYALLDERWESVQDHLTIGKSVEAWLSQSENALFKAAGGKITFMDQPVHANVEARIKEMAARGEDPAPLFRFWERLQKNPSYRSVHQLYDFLKHRNIPITKDGHFLAYKNVRQDYKDHHSGQYDNSPGVMNSMPRNMISDDPEVACHEGFHVGALGYVRSFNSSGRVVVCKIDPMDVVCVPRDSSQEKIRVSVYEVIGNYGEDLSSTVHEEDVVEDTVEEKEAKASGRKEKVKKTVEKKKLEGKGVAKTTRLNTPRSKSFDKLDAMSVGDLMGLTLDDLRQYAFKGLKIVGASKISGGKTALVSHILRVRDKR